MLVYTRLKMSNRIQISLNYTSQQFFLKNYFHLVFIYVSIFFYFLAIFYHNLFFKNPNPNILF